MRADNADQRLTPLGVALGCVGERRQRAFEEKAEKLAKARVLLEARTFTSREITAAGIAVSADGSRRTAMQLLAFPKVSFDDIAHLDASFESIGAETREQLARDATYASYIERQQRDVEALKRD